MLAINDINNNRPTLLPDVALAADRIDANLTVPGTTYRQFLALAKQQTYSLFAGPLSTELTSASTLFSSYKSVCIVHADILRYDPVTKSEHADKSRWSPVQLLDYFNTSSCLVKTCWQLNFIYKTICSYSYLVIYGGFYYII